jgi:hypothetical protein
MDNMGGSGRRPAIDVCTVAGTVYTLAVDSPDILIAAGIVAAGYELSVVPILPTKTLSYQADEGIFQNDVEHYPQYVSSDVLDTIDDLELSGYLEVDAIQDVYDYGGGTGSTLYFCVQPMQYQSDQPMIADTWTVAGSSGTTGDDIKIPGSFYDSTDMYYAWSFDNTADPDTMN